jgi:hypothetical protein
MRIKKVNELNTTERDTLMGGKISNEDAMRLLDTFASINTDAKKFKESSSALSYQVSAFLKSGIINFVTEGEKPMTLTVNINITFKEGDEVASAPTFGSRTTGYTPPRPGSEIDKPLNPPKFGSRITGYNPPRNIDGSIGS